MAPSASASFPRLDGSGRVPAVEVMVVNGRIQQAILDPLLTSEIEQIIVDGEYYGMQTFDQALARVPPAGRDRPARGDEHGDQPSRPEGDARADGRPAGRQDRDRCCSAAGSRGISASRLTSAVAQTGQARPTGQTGTGRPVLPGRYGSGSEPGGQKGRYDTGTQRMSRAGYAPSGQQSQNGSSCSTRDLSRSATTL